jgi:ATPases involved in chromosome partitioning
MLISITGEKGGVGKSTLAFNLAGALSENARAVLIDDDPIQSCRRWYAAGNFDSERFTVTTRQDLTKTDLQAPYLVVDTEGRPTLNDIADLTRRSDVVLIPTGSNGMDLSITVDLLKRLQALTGLERVKVVVTKAPPVGTVGQQARDALRALGLPVAETVIRQYSAHQKAVEQGVLVRDVPDPRASHAWADIQALANEVIGL